MKNEEPTQSNDDHFDGGPDYSDSYARICQVY
jgi:hypothetical protein